MSKSIWGKRRKVLLKIAEFSAGNVVIGGAPKPGAEIPSHIALIATDMVMCAMIHEEYFSESISEHSILEILGKAAYSLSWQVVEGMRLPKAHRGSLQRSPIFWSNRLDYFWNARSGRNCIAGASMDDYCRLGVSEASNSQRCRSCNIPKNSNLRYPLKTSPGL